MSNADERDSDRVELRRAIGIMLINSKVVVMLCLAKIIFVSFTIYTIVNQKNNTLYIVNQKKYFFFV